MYCRQMSVCQSKIELLFHRPSFCETTMDEKTFEGNVSFDLSIGIKRHFSSSTSTDKILNGNLGLLFVDAAEQNTKSPSEYYPLPFLLVVHRAHLFHCRRVLANV